MAAKEEIIDDEDLEAREGERIGDEELEASALQKQAENPLMQDYGEASTGSSDSSTGEMAHGKYTKKHSKKRALSELAAKEEIIEVRTGDEDLDARESERKGDGELEASALQKQVENPLMQDYGETSTGSSDSSTGEKAHGQYTKKHSEERVTKVNEQPKQSDALKNLNFQKDCEKMVASSLKQGLKEWPVTYEKVLEDFKKEPINIGVTGSSGTGKSSWINSMCHFERGHGDQYAKTDVIECTKKIKVYCHPQIENIWFWDMPGVNTPDYPRDSYLKKVMFEQYDALVIITKDRFTDDDLYLAMAAEEHGIPSYFVYSQFDLVIHSAGLMDTDETEQDIKCKIEAKIKTELEKAELNSKKIYFLSNAPKLRHKYDFQELERQIKNDIKHTTQNKKHRLHTSLDKIVQNMIDDEMRKVTEICETIKGKPDDEAYRKLEELSDWFGMKNTETGLQDIRQWKDKIFANIISTKDTLNKIYRLGKAGVVAGVGGTVGFVGAAAGAGAAAELVAVAGFVTLISGVVITGAALAGGTVLGVTLLMKDDNSDLNKRISGKLNQLYGSIETKARVFMRSKVIGKEMGEDSKSD